MPEEKRPVAGFSTPPSGPGQIELPEFPSVASFDNIGLLSQYTAIYASLARCQAYCATLFGLEPHDYPRHVDHSGDEGPAQNQKPHVPPIYKALTENRIRFAIWDKECGLDQLSSSTVSWLEVLDEISDSGFRRLVAGAFLNLHKTIDRILEGLIENSVAIKQKDKAAELHVLALCHQLGLGVTQVAELQPLIQMFRADMVKRPPEGPLASLKRRLVSLQSYTKPLILLRKDKMVDQQLDGAYRYSRSVALQMWKDIQSIRRNLPLFLRPLRQKRSLLALSDGQTLSFNVLRRTSLQVLLLVIHLFGVALAPLILLYPLWLGVLIFMGLGVAHKWLCGLLNTQSNPIVYSRGIDARERNSHEAWIFLPRLGTSHHELEHTLDRLSTAFRRQVTGIPSQTHGILPDLMRELLLRNTSYQTPMTQGVHNALYTVRREICDPARSKVVLLAHSSAGIHANIVVNLLLQQGLQHLLHKMEIYTFGGYFCHFSNPIDTALGQRRTPSGASSSTVPGETVVTRQSIAHIEHFANTDDPFALMGVLSRSNWSSISGDIFQLPGEDSQYKDQVGGFLFNRGYLDRLFPIAGQRPSVYSPMAELPVVMALGDAPEGVEQGHDSKHFTPGLPGNERALKNLSRLYQYIDGREPIAADEPSTPPLYE
ncbi:hypothetical protein B0T21DRAFT_4402 [Apiosordaria backusii]|uniref:Uncharacterized protein n=1 Tax=Apiosordaria backusii TaxID=314023 RepID=A0AA40K658_9PEZI|nr:hypothetical protein B0T21DRAFT_4402 [Apiosordaria backusii]